MAIKVDDILQPHKQSACAQYQPRRGRQASDAIRSHLYRPTLDVPNTVRLHVRALDNRDRWDRNDRTSTDDWVKDGSIIDQNKENVEGEKKKNKRSCAFQISNSSYLDVDDTSGSTNAQCSDSNYQSSAKLLPSPCTTAIASGAKTFPLSVKRPPSAIMHDIFAPDKDLNQTALKDHGCKALHEHKSDVKRQPVFAHKDFESLKDALDKMGAKKTPQTKPLAVVKQPTVDVGNHTSVDTNKHDIANGKEESYVDTSLAKPAPTKQLVPFGPTGPTKLEIQTYELEKFNLTYEKRSCRSIVQFRADLAAWATGRSGHDVTALMRALYKFEEVVVRASADDWRFMAEVIAMIELEDTKKTEEKGLQ